MWQYSNKWMASSCDKQWSPSIVVSYLPYTTSECSLCVWMQFSSDCEELWLLCWEGIWPIIVINRACSSKVVLFTHVFITTGWYGLVLRCSTKAMCKWLSHQSMALRSGRKLRRKCLLERSQYIWKLFLHNLGTITAASLSLFTSSVLQFAPQHAATKMYLLHRLKATVSSDYDYLK